MSGRARVLLPILLACGCLSVLLTQLESDGKLLSVAAAVFQFVYAAIMAFVDVPPRATRWVKTTTILIAITVATLLASLLFISSINLGCRDCQGAGILIIIPLIAVAIVGGVSLLLEAVVLLILLFGR